MVLQSIAPLLREPPRASLTLSMAPTLAGNVTPPGSLATLIVVGAKGPRTDRVRGLLRVGLPTAVASLVIGAARLDRPGSTSDARP
jgi:Na+/H+ antiporter NhaD/arsenite permease-like protein